MTPAAPLGGGLEYPSATGEVGAARLTLTVADVPGTYYLTFADGQFVAPGGAAGTITGGQVLTITVQDR